MLTPESLAEKIKLWSTCATADSAARAGVFPILFQQDLYGLVHELKSSVGVSADPEIKALAPLIANLDEFLGPLARDEIELSSESIARVTAAASAAGRDARATSLDAALGQLAATVAAESRLAAKPAQDAPKILAERFPWDSLSRARATSCARRECTFITRSDELKLAELAALDETLGKALRALGGLVVARRADLSPSSSATAVVVVVRTLAALPAGVEARPDGWT